MKPLSSILHSEAHLIYQVFFPDAPGSAEFDLRIYGDAAEYSMWKPDDPPILCFGSTDHRRPTVTMYYPERQTDWEVESMAAYRLLHQLGYLTVHTDTFTLAYALVRDGRPLDNKERTVVRKYLKG